VTMARRTPSALTVRTYDVGFGDCFLLSFQYARGERHVLIDFGSMAWPAKKIVDGKPFAGNYANLIARTIAEDCGGKLHAVVATHRHQDHVSGFARRNGKGSGEIIRALKPEIVIQPWTEDPRAPTDAAAPARRGFARTLLGMQQVASQVVDAAKGLQGERLQGLRTQLQAVGMDNIQNPDAVENLRTMAPNHFVHHGSNAGLGRLLPGVRTTVLGPPTVEQTDSVRTQRSTDDQEFWQLANTFWQRLAATGEDNRATTPPLFPRHATRRLPRAAGWYRYIAMQEQGNALLSIVRALDKAMNNTSVILLFEVGPHSLLFPGDAQYENWMYALAKPAIRARLARVELYKVGHHGSLNATPKTLWNAFSRKGGAKTPQRLRTLLSTMSGVHGDPQRRTEVPRRSLLRALSEESQLTNTQRFAPDELRRALTLNL
jgi:hypothetical protein